MDGMEGSSPSAPRMNGLAEHTSGSASAGPAASICKAVDAAVEAFGKGRHVILSHGQGGCSLALAAEHATAESIAFMLRQSSGIVSACLDRERLEAFGMHPSASSTSRASYSPVDFAPACTTGVSAKERALTLRALCDTSNGAASFSRPGHTFITCARRGGVLDLSTSPEAAVDLCRLARLTPVGTVAELMKEDGEMYTAEDCQEFSRQHKLPLLSISDLVEYLRRQEGSKFSGIQLESESRMWVEDIEADCSMRVYATDDPKVEIIIVSKGDLQEAEGVPTRIHSECFTGDVLASKRCDCGQQLHLFLQILNKVPNGVLLYIRGHEGRGIGLSAKIRAYKLQDEGLDTVDANLKLGLPVDGRSYESSLAVLLHLGLKSIRLFTNNPEKVRALQLITSEVVALASAPSERNRKYLETKRERLNHRTVLQTFKLPELSVDTTRLRVGVVYTTWNHYYVDELRRVAEAGLAKAGVRSISLAVPGACELISGARALMRQAAPDAVIVLGVLIRGSSDLYDATCTAVMTGLTELNASQDTPIIVGLLMCQNEEQAQERSHGASNPAKAWAETALHMASLAMRCAGGLDSLSPHEITIARQTSQQ